MFIHNPRYLGQLRGLPKENWCLFFAMLVNSIGSMAFLLMGLYLHIYLNFSISLTGSIIATYGIGTLLASPIGGWLSDLFGPIVVMCISMTMTIILLLLFLFFSTPIALFILMLLWALTSACFRPANMVAVSYFCHADQRKLAFALNRLASNLGLSIAPTLGGILAGFNFHLIFVINAITMLGGLIIILVTMKKHWRLTKINDPNGLLGNLHIPFNNYYFRMMLIPLILMMIIYFLTQTPLALYVVQFLKYKPYVYGLLFAINTLLIVIFEVPVNLVTNNWSPRRTLCLGSLFIALSFGIFNLAHHIPALALGIIFFTAGEVLFQPGAAAYITQISPTQYRGAYMGVYNLCFCTGLILAPTLGACVLNFLPAHFLWLVALIIGLSATLLFWQVVNKDNINFDNTVL